MFDTIGTEEIQGLIETTTVTSVRSNVQSALSKHDAVKNPEDRKKSTELWKKIIGEIGGTSSYFKETTSTSAALSKPSKENSEASFVIQQKAPLIMLRLQLKDYEALVKKKDVIGDKLKLKEELELTWRRSEKNRCQILLRNPELSKKIAKNNEMRHRENPEKKQVTPQDSIWPEITQFFQDNIGNFESVLDGCLEEVRKS